MRPARLRAALGSATLTLARNLPLSVLGGGAYFVFFRDVWGPLHAWKVALAVLTLVCLALAVRRVDPGEESSEMRRRQGPGGHAAVLRAAWPPWRRAAAVLAGALLCFAGIYQSLGREVDLRAYPLISGLCLIVSVAVGVILVVLGWPREVWRSRLRRARPTRTRRPARPTQGPPPEPAVRTGGTTFKLPTPRDQGHSGWFRYGGVGTRPAPRPWMPGRRSRASEAEGPVPARLRGLRLLRRRRPRDGAGGGLGLALLVVVVLAVFGLLLRGCA